MTADVLEKTVDITAGIDDAEEFDAEEFAAEEFDAEEVAEFPDTGVPVPVFVEQFCWMLLRMAWSLFWTEMS